MKIPMPLLLLLLVPVITAGCGSSSPDQDSVSSHIPAAAGVTLDCLACHASQKSPSLNPLLTNGVAPAGTHSAHVTDAGIVCVKCHYNYTSQASHMNGTFDMPDPDVVIVYFDSTNPNGQWIGDTGPQIGSCFNVYCHSIVQTTTGGPLTLDNADHYKTPTWGGDLATCTSCHGNPPVSGSHQKHAVVLTGRPDRPELCEECHSGHVPPSATATHADGAINTVMNSTWGGAYNGNTTPGNGFSNCSNTYCHSNGTSVATGVITSNTSPTWGSAAVPLACNTCHGAAGSDGVVNWPATPDGRPSYPQMTEFTASPKANAHDYHKSLLTCQGCHYTTTTTGNTITNSSTHANGQYDVVVAPNMPYDFTYVPDPGGLGGYCSTVSCHGSSSPPAFWGKFAPYITGILITDGPGCFEAKFSVTAMSNVDYPVTYTWTFGDDTPSESGTSSTLPISSASHSYVDGTPLPVTITGRDKLQRYLSKSTTVTPQPIGNVSPTGNFTVVDINRFTVTIKDLSYDPDYNSCGHGPGNIFITWKPGTTNNFIIDLTDVPSNTSYTTTLGTYNAAGTYSIGHKVCDHNYKPSGPAGTCSSLTYKDITLPGPTSISGKVFKSDGTGLASVTVDLIREWYSIPPAASTTTDEDGSYSFNGAYNYEYYRIVPSMGGYTFSPTYQYVYINRDDVNFTASPSP